MSGEFKYIVRIAGRDLDGTCKIVEGLARIRGVGWGTALAICRLLGIDTERRLGELSEEELKKVEDLVYRLHEKLPGWYVNRPRDPYDGKNYHLVESDLVLKVRADVELLKKIRCWRGIRHMLGLKVRGQKTRTTGRTGMTVGVTKKGKR